MDSSIGYLAAVLAGVVGILWRSRYVFAAACIKGHRL